MGPLVAMHRQPLGGTVKDRLKGSVLELYYIDKAT
jgi:hypothetical protein